MKIKTPEGWRKGQTIFNFLEWMKKNKNYGTNQNFRMADPFYISDRDLDDWFNEFLQEQKDD